MIALQEFQSGSRAEDWNRKLFAFRDVSFQQTHEFGELERSANTEVRRWLLADGGQTLVMAQGRLRRLPAGGCVLTIRRGPVYQASDDDQTNLKHLRTFLTSLIDETRATNRYWHVNLMMAGERSAATEIALRETGLTRPFFDRAPYLTYVVPIHQEVDRNLKGFDRKWRNQLRRAESLGPEFRWGHDDAMLEAYVALHNAMCRVKQIESYVLSAESLFAMRRHLGDRLRVLIGSHGGEDVCGCVVLVTGTKAFYYYAAANEAGRNGYFSNAMVWRLIQGLRDSQVSELDLSPIDPVQNWGGYHFKKGVGGRAVAYDGEWEVCHPRGLKLPINLALAWRTSRLYR